MAIVFWLNVLGIEAWLNFSVLTENFNESYVRKKRLRLYSVYAWIAGGITTIPTILRNIPNILDNCNKYGQSKSCVIISMNFCHPTPQSVLHNFVFYYSLYDFICGYLFCPHCYDSVGHKFSNILRGLLQSLSNSS